MLMKKTAITLKDLSSVLASQGILETELTDYISVKTWIVLMLRLFQYHSSSRVSASRIHKRHFQLHKQRVLIKLQQAGKIALLFNTIL